MAKEFGKSLRLLTLSLTNVVSKLFQKHPFIFLCTISIVGLALMYFTKSEQKMTFGLCILISFVSILIYAKTKNYAETLLSFMLGVLTIFTIKWNTYTSTVFVGFYLALNTIIFFIKSIQLGIKMEDALTSAASYIDLKNFTPTYKRLEEICLMDTQYNSFGKIERAETIKYLAYMKVPIGGLKKAIENIELIKVVYQVDLKTSCDFYKSLYFIQLRTKTVFSITNVLNIISDKRLPLMPEEFLQILQKTKKELIYNKYPIKDYLNIIDESASEGEDIEGIIETIKSKVADSDKFNLNETPK